MIDLPIEILISILSFLYESELGDIFLVCSTMAALRKTRDICQRRTIYISNVEQYQERMANIPECASAIHFGSWNYRFTTQVDWSLLPPWIESVVMCDIESEQNMNQLPITVRKLVLPPLYEKPLILSPTLTELTFDRSFDEMIAFPPTLTHLYFGIDFNQPIHKGMLPNTLIEIVFGSAFNQPLGDDVLPRNLVTLTFGYSFNQHIVLPPNLKTLRFGDSFNQPIESFPQTLKSLVFDYEFNQPMDGLLPMGLEYLEFDYSFNQPLTSLPPNLKAILFGDSFEYPVVSKLPASLEHVEFGWNFSESLAEVPMSVTYINLRNNYEHPSMDIVKERKHLKIAYEGHVIGEEVNHDWTDGIDIDWSGNSVILYNDTDSDYNDEFSDSDSDD
jgi:FNIP Repeat